MGRFIRQSHCSNVSCLVRPVVQFFFFVKVEIIIVHMQRVCLAEKILNSLIQSGSQKNAHFILCSPTWAAESCYGAEDRVAIISSFCGEHV